MAGSKRSPSKGDDPGLLRVVLGDDILVVFLFVKKMHLLGPLLVEPKLVGSGFVVRFFFKDTFKCLDYFPKLFLSEPLR